MTLEDTIRQVVRDEVRAVVREEVRAAFADTKRDDSPPTTLLTVEQVAGRVGVTAETVRNWIRSGRLATQKAGRRHLIKPLDLEQILVRSDGAPQSNFADDDHLALLARRSVASKRTR